MATSAADIDVNLINQSLAHVNTFSRRRQAEKLQPVLMYEIPCVGESQYRTCTLRELLAIIHTEASHIDEVYWGQKLPSATSNTADDLDKDVNVVSSLRLRDLRRLDYAFNPNEEKSILIRKHAVLFAMDPIRAVVMSSRLILIVPDGADSLISILDQYMKEWNTTDDAKPVTQDSNSSSAPLSLSNPHSSAHAARAQQVIPFEQHAYEALITTVKALEVQELARLDKAVQSALVFFKSASLVPVSIQEEMRSLKNDLSLMTNRILSTKRVLQTLTEDDEEMCLMQLTLLKLSPRLYVYPLHSDILNTHDEIEELLESYLIDFSALEMKMLYMKSQIQSAEELVSLRLDTSRNELLIANTALAVLACSIGFGAYITGIFGMNLDNVDYLEPVDHVFVVVCVCSFACIACIFASILYYLRMQGMLPMKTSARAKGSSGSTRMGSAGNGGLSSRAISTA